MPVRIEILRDRCIGSGNCAFWLPDVFALDDTDVAVVVDESAATPARVNEIARVCPTQAILVTDDGSGNVREGE